MNAVAIDTLKFANRLKAAGFNDQQAEAITGLQQESAMLTLVQVREEYQMDELVTRSDLDKQTAVLQHATKELEVAMKTMETDLRRDMKEMEIGLRHDMKEMETNMKNMEIGLKHDIALLRTETQRDMAMLKTDLTRWVIGVGLLQTSLITGVLLRVAHFI